MRPLLAAQAAALLMAALPFGGGTAAVPKIAAVAWPTWSFPANGDAGLTGAISSAGPHGVAQVADNVFRISRNRGRKWLRHVFPTDYILEAVRFWSAKRGFIVAEKITFAATDALWLSTDDGGRHWTERPLNGAQGRAMSYAVASGGTLVAATVSPNYSWSPGGVLLSRSQHRFRTLKLPSGFSAWDAAFGPGGRLWVVGQVKGRGRILVSNDAGRSFRTVLTAPEPVTGIAFHGNVAVAVGGAPEPKFTLRPAATQWVARSTDDGARWHTVFERSHESANFSRVVWAGGNVGYAISGTAELGANGPGFDGIWRTSDGGQQWRLVVTGTVTGDALVGRRLWATVDGVLLLSSTAGRSWLPIDTPQGVDVMAAAVSHRAAGSGWITVNLGVASPVLYTADGGRTWTRVGYGNPEFPIQWTSRRTGFAVNAVAIWRTMNRGRTWTRLKMPPGYEAGGLGGVNFLSADTGFVTVSDPDGSNLYQLDGTTNGGTSWTTLGTLPFVTAIDFANPERGLVLSVNGWAVTTDGGVLWTWHRVPAGTVVGPAALDASGRVWLFETLDRVIGPAMNRLVIVNPNGRTMVKPLPSRVQVGYIGFGRGGTVWLAANGVLYQSTNGGSRWHSVDIRVPPPPALTGNDHPFLQPADF